MNTIKRLLFVLVLTAFACTNKNEIKPNLYQPLVGYWKFQSCTVSDNVDKYVYKGGCDFSQVPAKFQYSTFEVNLQFVDGANMNVVLVCANNANVPYGWKLDDKSIYLNQLYSGAIVFEILNVSNNSLELKMTQMSGTLTYQPVFSFHK